VNASKWNAFSFGMRSRAEALRLPFFSAVFQKKAKLILSLLRNAKAVVKMQM
jgi:hypothetical protein